jgi:hypothetical protein
MPDFRPFNYAQAVQSGQNVAMNALKLREGVRGIQGRNILSGLSAQGLTGFQKYNALQQAGFGGLAQEEQTRELKVNELKSNYAKSQLERVGSYETFMSMADSLETQGVATRQQTMDKFDITDDPASYDAALPAINAFLERETAATLASKTKKHFSGQDIFKDASGKLFMGTGVGDPKSGVITPSMVAIDGSGAKPSGKLSMVSSLGLTSGEVIDYKARLQSAEIRSKDDATFYTDYIPETRNIESEIDDMEMTQDLLNDMAGQTDYSTVGFGKYLNKIPLTDATHWAELKSTIQARIALTKMMTLKNASATGSTGFGQLSEKELKLLTDHLGSLEQAQSPEEIKKVIGQIYKTLDSTMKGYRKQLLQNRRRFKGLHKEYYGKSRELPSIGEETPEPETKLSSPQTEDEYNALPSGSEYIDPDDGKTYRKP